MFSVICRLCHKCSSFVTWIAETFITNNLVSDRRGGVESSWADNEFSDHTITFLILFFLSIHWLLSTLGLQFCQMVIVSSHKRASVQVSPSPLTHTWCDSQHTYFPIIQGKTLTHPHLHAWHIFFGWDCYGFAPSRITIIWQYSVPAILNDTGWYGDPATNVILKKAVKMQKRPSSDRQGHAEHHKCLGVKGIEKRIETSTRDSFLLARRSQ